MAAKNQKQVKKQEPVQQVEQKTPEQLEARGAQLEGNFIDKKCPKCGARLLGNKVGDEWCSNVNCNYGLIDEIKQESRTTSTIQVSIENKGRLDTLKEMMNQPDYNSTLTRIINFVPERLSTEEEKHLVMTVSQYRWLLSHQDSCDCRKFLADAVR